MNSSASSGQVIIILLLVMVVSLAIGLSVVGRSITEISTSTNSESSSRAFSAAEAGIEKLLYDSLQDNFGATGNQAITTLTNQSEAQISWDADLPKANTALEYPPFGKESFAQFWLADPATLASFYTANNFDLYFGDPSYPYADNPDNYPAIEVHVISLSGGVYTSTAYYFDSKTETTRSGFLGCIAPRGTKDNPLLLKTNNNSTATSKFLCKVNVSYLGNYPVMVRVRMLYTNSTHPVALQPATGGSFPPQARIFNSKGTSGNVQRNLQVFQEINFMPHILDYAIFSLGALEK